MGAGAGSSQMVNTTTTENLSGGTIPPPLGQTPLSALTTIGATADMSVLTIITTMIDDNGSHFGYPPIKTSWASS